MILASIALFALFGVLLLFTSARRLADARQAQLLAEQIQALAQQVGGQPLESKSTSAPVRLYLGAAYGLLLLAIATLGFLAPGQWPLAGLFALLAPFLFALFGLVIINAGGFPRRFVLQGPEQERVQQALLLRQQLEELGDLVSRDFNSAKGRDVRLAGAADVSLAALQVEQARLSLEPLVVSGNLAVRKAEPYWQHRPLLTPDQQQALLRVASPQTRDLLQQALQRDAALRQS
jgi:hypothetical protein